MKIAILGGTGALGLGLASRWIRSGHEVLIGSRTIESAKSACGKLNINEDQGMLNVDAANQAEIACLTVPFSFQLDILSEVKDALSGKILIDGTVPLVPPKVMRVQLPEEGCAAIRAKLYLEIPSKLFLLFKIFPLNFYKRMLKLIAMFLFVAIKEIQESK